jgi:hypothetical protein
MPEPPSPSYDESGGKLWEAEIGRRQWLATRHLIDFRHVDRWFMDMAVGTVG